MGKKCLGLGGRLTKKLKKGIRDFIKRCYVTVHVNFNLIFCGFIAFRECYVCAKNHLNRWGKKCLGLGGRLTKKGKLKSDESQNGVTSLYT